MDADRPTRVRGYSTGPGHNQPEGFPAGPILAAGGEELSPPIDEGAQKSTGEVKHLLFAKLKPTVSRHISLPVMSKYASRQKGEGERKSPNWDSGALE